MNEGYVLYGTCDVMHPNQGGFKVTLWRCKRCGGCVLSQLDHDKWHEPTDSAETDDKGGQHEAVRDVASEAPGNPASVARRGVRPRLEGGSGTPGSPVREEVRDAREVTGDAPSVCACSEVMRRDGVHGVSCPLHRPASDVETDLRDFLKANLFDGDDGGTITWPIAGLLDDIVENIAYWGMQRPADSATVGVACGKEFGRGGSQTDRVRCTRLANHPGVCYHDSDPRLETRSADRAETL